MTNQIKSLPLRKVDIKPQSRYRSPSSQFSALKREEWRRKKNLEALGKSLEKKMVKGLL